MLAPAVMFIEMGSDMLKLVSDFIRDAQRKELHAFGDERAKRIGASGLTPDFQIGYELGLETARAIIAGSMEVASHKCNPDKIL